MAVCCLGRQLSAGGTPAFSSLIGICQTTPPQATTCLQTAAPQRPTRSQTCRRRTARPPRRRSARTAAAPPARGAPWASLGDGARAPGGTECGGERRQGFLGGAAVPAARAPQTAAQINAVACAPHISACACARKVATHVPGLGGAQQARCPLPCSPPACLQRISVDQAIKRKGPRPARVRARRRGRPAGAGTRAAARCECARAAAAASEAGACGAGTVCGGQPARGAARPLGRGAAVCGWAGALRSAAGPGRP